VRIADEGFTLTELLIVLMVLGIMASIGVLAFSNSHKSSTQGACKTNFQTSLLAVQAYQSDNAGALPASLRVLAPTYINSGLIDSSAFALSLQSFPGISDSYSIVVTPTGGANSTAVLDGTFLSSSGNNFNYQVADTSNISQGEIVSGSGIPSIFYTSANAASGSNSLIVADGSGISTGMLVTGNGVPSGTYVTSVSQDSTTGVWTVALSQSVSAALNTAAISFGANPIVSNVGAGQVTLSVPAVGQGGQAITTNSAGTPVANALYSLIFGGTPILGTAPTACLSL
jgi:prepilin-type N-terminal cleavage/methylation domain-containing protein